MNLSRLLHPFRADVPVGQEPVSVPTLDQLGAAVTDFVIRESAPMVGHDVAVPGINADGKTTVGPLLVPPGETTQLVPFNQGVIGSQQILVSAEQRDSRLRGIVHSASVAYTTRETGTFDNGDPDSRRYLTDIEVRLGPNPKATIQHVEVFRTVTPEGNAWTESTQQNPTKLTELQAQRLIADLRDIGLITHIQSPE